MWNSSMAQKNGELCQNGNLQNSIAKWLQTVLRIHLANTIKYEALWKEMGHERIKLQIRKRKWSWLGDTL